MKIEMEKCIYCGKKSLKSFFKILDFRKRGVNIFFVSHSMGEIRNLCDRILWLDHGRMKMIGKPDNVVAAYQSG